MVRQANEVESDTHVTISRRGTLAALASAGTLSLPGFTSIASAAHAPDVSTWTAKNVQKYGEPFAPRENGRQVVYPDLPLRSFDQMTVLEYLDSRYDDDISVSGGSAGAGSWEHTFRLTTFGAASEWEDYDPDVDPTSVTPTYGPNTGLGGLGYDVHQRLSVTADSQLDDVRIDPIEGAAGNGLLNVPAVTVQEESNDLAERIAQNPRTATADYGAIQRTLERRKQREELAEDVTSIASVLVGIGLTAVAPAGAATWGVRAARVALPIVLDALIESEADDDAGGPIEEPATEGFARTHPTPSTAGPYTGRFVEFDVRVRPGATASITVSADTMYDTYNEVPFTTETSWQVHFEAMDGHESPPSPGEPPIATIQDSTFDASSDHPDWIDEELTGWMVSPYPTQDGPSPSIRADPGNPAPIDGGTSVTFDGHDSVLEGAHVPVENYEWAVYRTTPDLHGGSTLQVDPVGEPYVTGSGPEFSFVVDEGGQEHPDVQIVSLTLTDENGNQATAEYDLELHATDRPRVRLFGDQSSVRPGESVFFRAYLDNMSGDVDYYWSESSHLSSPSATITFDEPGEQTVSVVARDETGNSGSDSFTVSVERPDPSVELSTDYLRNGTGSYELTAETTGTIGDLVYNWYADGVPMGIDGERTLYSPRSTTTIRVEVVDRGGDGEAASDETTLASTTYY